MTFRHHCNEELRWRAIGRLEAAQSQIEVRWLNRKYDFVLLTIKRERNSFTVGAAIMSVAKIAGVLLLWTALHSAGAVLIGVSCRGGEVLCANRNKCIPLDWMCDGANDCDDGSDERGCGEFFLLLIFKQRKVHMFHKCFTREI
ncbi:hypothetical protein TNCV_4447341 [Trichonephila clavipes]|nr:hypothetical protein TNCV_4447341 [Trichonephila clavipes]